MASLQVANAGQALIAFNKAKIHAESRYNKMRNCARCSKQEAEQWKRDAEMFQELMNQLTVNIEV